MVPRRLHVRDAVRRDAVLRRVARRDVRQDHEPRGEGVGVERVGVGGGCGLVGC